MSRLKRPVTLLGGAEAQAVDELYRRYAGWLKGKLRRRFGTNSAEDLVQETYLRIATARPREIEHPRALLMRTAVNIGYNQAKHAARRSGVATVLARHDAAEIDVADLPSQSEALSLKEIVLGLPPLYRDVFLLSRFEGLTYAEMAGRLGVSTITVERRMAKALALCAAQMRD
jgi:RNA polymerase sigma-70 factor (ECF subfamily)